MINLNTCYWVKLNAKGIKIYNTYYADLSITRVYNQPDNDGWIRLQLWLIMRIFGYKLNIGLHNLPFDDMNLYEEKPNSDEIQLFDSSGNLYTYNDYLRDKEDGILTSDIISSMKFNRDTFMSWRKQEKMKLSN